MRARRSAHVGMSEPMKPLAIPRRSPLRDLSGPGPGVAVVLFVDHDLRVSQCSGPVGECFGADAAELPGRRLGTLLNSRSARIAERNARRALERIESRTFDVDTRLPAGRRLQMHTAPLLAGEDVAGVVVVARPPDLADPAPAATRGATADADLARLAAIVSHDLSEPLQLIQGYAELLRKDAAARLTADDRDHVDVISRTAKRMQALIDALLRHGEVGGATVGLDPVDMERVVDDALAMLETHIDESGAIVRTGPLLEVPGNARLLSVLVRNLLSNAMKFCHERTPLIDISCEPVADGWRLRVSDNGIGIPEQDQRRIFEMFARLDRMRLPGFGIGLASVQRIAELHGGTVEVSSEVGVGTTFDVLLTTRRD